MTRQQASAPMRQRVRVISRRRRRARRRSATCTTRAWPTRKPVSNSTCGSPTPARTIRLSTPRTASAASGAVFKYSPTPRPTSSSSLSTTCAPLTLVRTRPCACGRPDPAVNPIPCPTNRRSADARLPCAADHPDPDRAGRVRLHVPRHRFVAKGLRRGDHNQAEPARPGQAVPVLQRWRAHGDDCPAENRQRHQDRCH